MYYSHINQARNSSTLEALAEWFQFPDLHGLCRKDMKKVGEKDRRKNQGQLRSEQEEICGQNNSQGQNLGGWGLTLDRNKQCTKIRQTNFCHGHSSSEPIQSPLTAHITLSTTRHCWKTRNGRRGKPEESQGHLLVFGRCYPAWLLSSLKRHIASLAGIGSKKDKGIFELLSHLEAFCTEKPKAGLTIDEVFVSTSVCDKNVFLAR